MSNTSNEEIAFRDGVLVNGSELSESGRESAKSYELMRGFHHLDEPELSIKALPILRNEVIELQKLLSRDALLEGRWAAGENVAVPQNYVSTPERRKAIKTWEHRRELAAKQLQDFLTSEGGAKAPKDQLQIIQRLLEVLPRAVVIPSEVEGSHE